MSALHALVYSFLFGLLHGILPDEHTWPITFSYAIGGASGRQGMKAGLYFSGAFTVQRLIVSELSYLALAPFLLSPIVNGIVYVIVGVVMSIAGWMVLRRNRYPHVHIFRTHHEEPRERNRLPGVGSPGEPVAPPPRWTIIHGFIAGFGFGGFSLFINTIAAPAMPSAFLGFLPGLLFGLGTMIMLMMIGMFFGTFLRWRGSLKAEEIQWIGAKTGGRTLFYGGFLFCLTGAVALLRLENHLPADPGQLLIAAFMILVALPAFLYSLREIRRKKI